MPILVEALISKGLSLLGNAVLAKGQDVIEEKLGISLKADASPEELAKYKALEIAHEEFLITAAIDKAKVDLSLIQEDNKNTASARDMNTHIQESESASQIAKNAAYILDFLIVGFTIAAVLFLFFKGVPPENKEYFYMALGALLAHTGTIINFHRGTSARNAAKDETIRTLSSGVSK